MVFVFKNTFLINYLCNILLHITIILNDYNFNNFFIITVTLRKDYNPSYIIQFGKFS